jgi:uncharacterized protein
MYRSFSQADPCAPRPVPLLLGACWFHGLLALVLLALGGWSARCAAQEPVPSLRVHVTDSAGVLGEQATAISRKLIAFEEATGNQVLVLTVPSTQGQSIEEYAVQVFRKSKIGQRKLDNGVLFVIAANDRKMRIEVGYGLEGVLTDARSSRILHEIVAPRFAAERIGDGIEAGVEEILNTIEPSRANLTTGLALQSNIAPQRHRELGVPEAMIAGVFFLVFWAVSLLLGVPGFVLLVALPMLIARLKLPGTFTGAFGWWMVAYVVFPWLYLRWRLIARTVRAYRLPSSTCAACTWSWAFAFMPVLFRLRQSRSGSGNDLAWPGSIDSGVSGGSNGGGSESAGGGGESGGGGASASW